MAEENKEKEIAGEPEEAVEETTEETAQEEPGDSGPAQEPETEDAQEEQTGDDTAEKEKKDKKDVLIEELNDRVRRQMAEFDNFRKRSEKEKSGMFELGEKSVIEKLLPIVDNFERGLGALDEASKADPFADGMEKVYRQMQEMLEKLGVKPIEAVGCEFNPDFHNAVMHVDDEESPDNTVVEEFLKGYTYKDQVVRHSMVKVAN